MGAQQAQAPEFWQDNKRDHDTRLAMIELLISMMKVQNPCMCEKSRVGIPNLMRKIELILYRQASSLEEYKDVNTVAERLQVTWMNEIRRLEGLKALGSK